MSLGSSGQPSMIVSAKDLRSRLGRLIVVSSCKEVLCVLSRCTCPIVKSSSISFEVSGVYLKGCQPEASPFQGSTQLCSHIPIVTGASVEGVLVHLPESSI